MINYTISNTRFTVNPDGTQGRITIVLWSATKTNESVTGGIYGRGTVIPADYAPADKEYQSVTEQDCIDWVIDLEDQASIEAQLDQAIAALEHPVTGAGKPWQDSYPLWAVGVAYIPGDIRIYQTIGYECIQGHTSQSTWAPNATPALWTLYVPPSEGPQPWVQPTGAQDAYPIGAQVTHVGFVWTSLVDANVWEPSDSSPTLWRKDEPFP